LEAANPGFDRTLFLTAFVTGAREGELLALRWTDLELTREGPGKMAIRRSLSWARLKGEEIRPRYFPPKTKAGRSSVCSSGGRSPKKWSRPRCRREVSAFSFCSFFQWQGSDLLRKGCCELLLRETKPVVAFAGRGRHSRTHG